MTMNRAIEVYSPDVRQGIEQYKAGLAIKDATDQEYAALYILCKQHSLDAYNQEAYIIPGKGVMVGIKGLRKSANQQLARDEYYNANPRLLQHSEYGQFGLDEKVPPKGQTWEGNQRVWKDNPIVLVYVCELTRSDANQKWINQAVALTGLTGNYEEALKLIGPRPVWVGVGVVRALDKSKMEMVQLARKRAEADATKLAFNLPFNVDVERDADQMAQPGDVIDAEVVHGGAAPELQAPDTYPDEQYQEVAEERTARPYPPEMVRKGIQDRVKHKPGATKATDKQMKYVRALLDSAFNQSATPEKDRHAVTKWLIGKESSKELTIAEAGALIEWLAAEGDGDLGMDGYNEAHAILAEVMKEEGQLPLPMDEVSQ
jgi:hypothetical protein